MGKRRTKEELKQELTERVLFSLFLPAVRMAQRNEVALKTLTNALELAYFHQLRDSGMKMREMAPHLNVGMRKVAELSKELKSAFFAAEREQGLPRRIEHMLWAKPLSAARIKQSLKLDDNEVDEALAILIKQKRVSVKEKTRPNGTKVTLYEVSREPSRQTGRDILSRIDGLNWLLRSVGNIVESRFFEPKAKAFARVVSLGITEENRQKLERVYEDVLWPVLAEMARENEDNDDAESVDFVLGFAPRKTMKLGSDE